MHTIKINLGKTLTTSGGKRFASLKLRAPDNYDLSCAAESGTAAIDLVASCVPRGSTAQLRAALADDAAASAIFSAMAVHVYSEFREAARDVEGVMPRIERFVALARFIAAHLDDET